MKIIFNCHTEYDLKNQFGWAKHNPPNRQSFEHVLILLDWLRPLNLPMVFALAVGGPFQDNLLSFLKEHQVKLPKWSEKSIHYHSEKFSNHQWQWDNFLDETSYLRYLGRFKEFLGKKPSSMVFGKWQIDRERMDFLYSLGIKKDASWVSTKRTIARPFFIKNILEIPVVSYQGRPVNPFSRLSDFFLLRKIIKQHHRENLILQIGFHSYDFFTFKKKPRLRLIKRMILSHLLRLIKQYNIEIITLAQVKDDNFEQLEAVKMSLTGQLFRLLGH